MNQPRSNLGRFVDFIALIVKKPRTLNELAQAMGVKRSQTLRDYVHALHDEGLIYVSGWQETVTKPAPIYAWQPSVCCFQDVPYCSRKGAA